MRPCIHVLVLCSLAVAGCGDNPLAGKVDQLESKVAALEQQQEVDREALVARLQAIRVTSDNEEELAAVHAKLMQEDLSATELAELAERVQDLERSVPDWRSVAGSAQRAVYAVLHGTRMGNGDVSVTFVGTGFAVDSQRLVTNGHIADALDSLDQHVSDFNHSYDTNVRSAWLIVRNLTQRLYYRVNYYQIGKVQLHPEWDAEVDVSPDLALLSIAEGRMYSDMELLPSFAALSLRVGQPVATLGFPGELQGGYLEALFPIATFKDGTISALRPPQQGDFYTVQDTYVLQHNLDLSGGTSGSPIFDASGRVVAVNNAGIQMPVITVGGSRASVSQAALGFGIRVDKVHELIEHKEPVPAKPAAPAAHITQELEGRELRALPVFPNDGRLQERLRARLRGAP